MEDAVWVGRNAAVHKLSGRQSSSRWWATDGRKEKKHRAAAIKRCQCARVRQFKTAKTQSSVIREPPAECFHTMSELLRSDLLPSPWNPPDETMNFTFLAILQVCVYLKARDGIVQHTVVTLSAASQKLLDY